MLSATALAAQLQIEVRVNVQRGCQLVGRQREADGEQLGVLGFGTIARLDDSAGPLSAALVTTRLSRLECNPDTPYQLQVDGGLHGGIGEVRYLTGSAEHSKPIPYCLYRDAARQIPLPVNALLSGRVPDSGTVDLPLYARIERLAEIPHVSCYSDLLKVTVSW
ncbi:MULTISPECIES: Csu type fimbrial protein [unclassified Pseudomonas]|nr:MULTISPECIES: spore coat U domain-containing protein [unclassified Pseudomonas]MBK5313097.1 spore coat protein U domain-containing protein [Pseudomonas sp. TH71]MBK5372301.1 spore coat protein U domain-containing protein [Pseudomonas sp. TH40]MBK5383470.1 spore coat protein U domain-containing protein [Pseudomonas sp. TH35]MBK5388929.1 spore coat protein U domain-containing protein [Pseudomonas sp. TH38]MBK5406224.1 spore coat protein U domain-containing protein [Pseudomonas sp. TH37]